MDAILTRSTMKNLTRYLGLAAKLLVFLLVLGFALKNSHTTIFYSYLGALTGVLALLPTLFRLRRELARAPLAPEADTITLPTDMPVV